MKKLYYLTLIIQAGFLSTINAQVYNDGAMITIQEDALVHIQGDFTSQGGEISNSGLIEIGGDWENAAMTFPLTPGSGTVDFLGENQIIGGMSPTLFYDLNLLNQTQITLESNIGIGNNLQINEGTIFLNENILHLLNPLESALAFTTGSVIAETSNTYGYVRWDIAEMNSGDYVIPFSTIGEINIPMTFSLDQNGMGMNGFMLFSTYGTDNNNVPNPIGITNLMIGGQNDGLDIVDRFWFVEAEDYTASPMSTISVSYDSDSEIDGMNNILQEELRLSIWDGMSSWESFDDNTIDMNSVTTEINDQYGSFALWSNCQIFDSNDLESGLGIWIDGGDDAHLSPRAEFANSGTNSILLKDNTETSVVTTPAFDLSGVDEFDITFNFIATGFNSSQEDFWLQISTDGGLTFNTVEDWVFNEDFDNNTREFVETTVMGPFSDETMLRFRCDATGNNDKVYLDDIEIRNCGFNEDPFCYEDENDFEAGLGIWIDGGDDAALSSRVEFANSGTNSILIKDNTETSVVTTPSLDLAEVTELILDFNFIATGFNNNTQDFWFQVSTDDGMTFTTVEDWVFTEDFDNDVREFVNVSISGPFSDQTQFRLRCDATGNNDKVYIDDLIISECLAMPLDSESEISSRSLEDQIGTKLYPNPIYSGLPLHISMEEAGYYDFLEIRGVSGQIIINKEINNDEKQITINTEALREGIYFVYLKNLNEQKVSKLIVVE